MGDERARQLVYPSVWLFDGKDAARPRNLMQMPAGAGTLFFSVAGSSGRTACPSFMAGANSIFTGDKLPKWAVKAEEAAARLAAKKQRPAGDLKPKAAQSAVKAKAAAT